ncbi:MAG: DNA polymerase/3'-5' exonuclease PolX [Candidatus Omnitrophota bacterium]|nr:DNA polymerase/3'-5' exonuclease PolX [Candidatus Omnitrophota bacterium]
MKNQEVANIFREISKILKLKGDNPFRIRAYERAAQNIESLGQDLTIALEEDNLTNIPGIGTDLASKIKEIIATGNLDYYEKLKKELPQGLLRMMEIPGLGPKTVKKIYEKFKIDNIEELEEAAREKKLEKLEGIREKTEENILRGIGLLKKGGERTPLHYAAALAESFVKELKKMEEIAKIEVAGSLRRYKETIKDIDILIVSQKPAAVMDRFVQLPQVKEVLAHGETKSSVISNKNNMQVDVRVVREKSFGSALMYFTGSKDFNIKLRQLAIKNNYKINEYGIFSASSLKKEKWLAGKTEEDIFSLLKMAYIAPELREDKGEIEAALENALPKLVQFKDIKGDLHVHSKYSDGVSSLPELARKAQVLGYDYVGICDHSQSLKVANGLSEAEVFKKLKEIRKINKKAKAKLLCGTEVDISSDGSLDYPDSLLREFDLVIAAIHRGFKQSKSELTKRIISACKNKYVNVIAHPTGRLWGARDAYEIDLDEILKVCRNQQVALEINCYPQRLDLNDVSALKAKKMNVKLCLGTDSHKTEQLTAMELGISVARRGWLEKKDVINCMPIDKLLKWLRK